MTGPDVDGPTFGWSAPEASPTVLDLDFGAGALHAVRAAVAARAGPLGATSSQVENLVVIASELATNAISYGGGGGRLRLWREDTLLYCEISDHGPGLIAPHVGEVRPPASAVGGRGLWLTRLLSDALDIAGTAGGGTTVTATIALNGPLAGRDR